MSELEHPMLDAFEPVVRSIFYDLSRVGYESFRRETGKDLEALTSAEYRRFIRLCHRGYGRAQRNIVRELIGINEHRGTARSALKKHRAVRDRQAVRQASLLIRSLDMREAVLRSLGDYLVILLIGPEPWILRRLSHFERPPKVDAETLRSTLKAAVASNARDTMTFAAMSDITSFYHAGDLVRVDKRQPRYVEIVELKERNTKEIIFPIIGTAGKEPRGYTPPTTAPSDQFARVSRQIHRLKQTEKTIKEERGVDQLTGRNLNVNAEPYELEFWHKEAAALLKELKTNNIAAAEIEGVLQVIALRPTCDDIPWGEAAAHAIFHTVEPDAPCLLHEDHAAELVQMKSRVSHLINLRSSLYAGDFFAPWFLPGADADVVMDVVFGRVMLIMHFDGDRCIELAKSKGIGLRWATKDERARAAEDKRVSQPADLLRGHLVLESGDLSVHVGPGSVKRVMFDFVRPSCILEMLKRSLDESVERQAAEFEASEPGV